LGRIDRLAGALPAPCQQDVDAIQAVDPRVSYDAIVGQADYETWIDGRWSDDQERDLYPVDSDEYAAYTKPDGWTVGESFNNDHDIHAETADPLSALAGNVYFNSGYVMKHSGGFDAALLMHETIHSLGTDDQVLKKALGVTSEGTDGITKKLATDCFGESAQ
jgi:hypothetical protein